MARCLIKEGLVDVSGGEIGEGAYGKVLSARMGEEEFALKVNLIDKKTSFHASLREIDILLVASDAEVPVVGLRGVLTDNQKIDAGKFRPERFSLLFRRAECDLTFFLSQTPSVEDRISISAQLCSAVGHLHDLRIIHRDIKPCNVLCVADEEGAGRRIVLCDFGMAKVHCEHDANISEIMTIEYRPPEVLQKRPYSFPADCWSLGCVIYETFFSTYLFNTKGERTEAWIKAEHRKLPRSKKGWEKRFPNGGADVEGMDAINKDWKLHLSEILSSLLEKDPTKRGSCKDALSSPLFAADVERLVLRKPGVRRPLADAYMVPVDPNRSAFVDMLVSTHGILSEQTWYSPRSLFMALALFDELSSMLVSPPPFPREWACSILYLSLKYGSDCQGICYEELFPSDLCTPESISAVSKYETLIVSDFFNFRLFRDTVYDHLSAVADPQDAAVELLHWMSGLSGGSHSMIELCKEKAPIVRALPVKRSSRRTKR